MDRDPITLEELARALCGLSAREWRALMIDVRDLQLRVTELMPQRNSRKPRPNESSPIERFLDHAAWIAEEMAALELARDLRALDARNRLVLSDLIFDMQKAATDQMLANLRNRFQQIEAEIIRDGEASA